MRDRQLLSVSTSMCIGMCRRLDTRILGMQAGARCCCTQRKGRLLRCAAGRCAHSSAALTPVGRTHRHQLRAGLHVDAHELDVAAVHEWRVSGAHARQGGLRFVACCVGVLRVVWRGGALHAELHTFPPAHTCTLPCRTRPALGLCAARLEVGVCPNILSQQHTGMAQHGTHR